ncbi:aminotransferase class V-fold PLP-dependent enzyme [Virgibacillus litoralis]|uniref:cysteine desulfurase n=1 Tax=Virgibacillus litoralis TaxID=578221 RepID=A0ABS4HFR6_9BACI|nr:aminotransferase class V-fold PLP-dependent enzyme [Virgibacillus litoralis]MBP1949454.1 cysteine desulfurase family protein [Virgibacillus litoralis]
MIYFDQAASSFPKPVEVGEAMVFALNEVGANPGRSGHHLARKASEIIQETRERAARIFGCSDPKRAIFFQNATGALNQAIKGLPWRKGDHIIATTVEHNSIRRPLENLKRIYGLEVSYIKWDEDDESFIEQIKKSINSNTKLIAMTHASNVTGSLLPIEKVANIVSNQNVLTLVDASQTAGHIPIHMSQMGIDLMAFPGHKGLLGPQGTGMLLIEGNIELQPIFQGGTGAFSEDPEQPNQMPEKLESGTLNTPGIAGLNAALKAFESRQDVNVPRETFLIEVLLEGLETIEGVTCYGPGKQKPRMPIVAFNIFNISSQEIAMILDSHYKIAVRSGLHCSPTTHESLNTIEQGVVRASLSIFNTKEEVDAFIKAINEIASSYKLI